MQQPSAFGYKTATPMHREARHMVKNRDMREKTVNEGMLPPPQATNPLQTLPDSAGYAPNCDRLRTDVSVSLKDYEEQRRDHKATAVRNLKESRLKKEHNRWEQMDAEQVKAENDAKAVAGSGLRNKGSVGYNLMNHSWGNSADAAKAKYSDDLVEYSAKLRSQNLDMRGNSGPVNIISGEQRTVVKVPPTPEYHPPAPTE